MNYKCKIVIVLLFLFALVGQSKAQIWIIPSLTNVPNLTATTKIITPLLYITADGDTIKLNPGKVLYPIDLEINNIRVFAADSLGNLTAVGFTGGTNDFTFGQTGYDVTVNADTIKGDPVLYSVSTIGTDASVMAIAVGNSGSTLTNAGILVNNGNVGIKDGNELRFYDVGNSNYVGFEAPALSANKIWVLPTADGSSGQMLSTNGSGTLIFVNPAAGTGGNDFADSARFAYGKVDFDKFNALHASDGSPDSAVYVDASGNLGIGTTSPATTLELSKSTNYGLATSDFLTIGPTYSGGTVSNPTSVGGIVWNAGATTAYDIARINAVLDDPSSSLNSHLEFWTYGPGSLSEKVRITTTGNVGIGTTDPTETFHYDKNAGVDGTGAWYTNASVSTTDATVTTVYTLATATDQAYRVLVDLIAAQDDGSNSMGALHSFTIKNVAGTVTEQGDVSIQETDDSAGVSISGAVSGTNYLIQVTGIAAENWNWEANVRVTVVAH